MPWPNVLNIVQLNFMKIIITCLCMFFYWSVQLYKSFPLCGIPNPFSLSAHFFPLSVGICCFIYISLLWVKIGLQVILIWWLFQSGPRWNMVLQILISIHLQYYLKTGTCKFGATCKFHHPREKAAIATRVQLNVLGYPIRPVCSKIPLFFGCCSIAHCLTIIA